MVQTEIIRKEIPLLLERLGVRSVLDVPCGDFNWMKAVDLGSIQYIGGDIVPDLVAKNQATYSSPTRRFELLDITTSPLPDADLIFCRDVFVHFSFDDILAAFENICHSNAQYLLTTTFPKRHVNEPISTGAWRPLNLNIDPFRLAAPIGLINEGCTEWNGQWADKSLGLWRVCDLSSAFR